MRRLAALFHEDAVWVLWTGEVWTGRAREDLAFVGPDAAVVRLQSTLTGDTRYPDGPSGAASFWVLTRTDGQWRIGWGQNTRFLSDMQSAEGSQKQP